MMRFKAIDCGATIIIAKSRYCSVIDLQAYLWNQGATLQREPIWHSSTAQVASQLPDFQISWPSSDDWTAVSIEISDSTSHYD